MARTSRNYEISSKNKRLKLNIRREPYWVSLKEGAGQHLGYRKTTDKQGTWIFRYYNKESGRRFKTLGTADDSVKNLADESTSAANDELSFAQAMEKAKEEILDIERDESAGVEHNSKYSVASAARDWLDAWHGTARGKLTAKTNVEMHILPKLGAIEISKLNRRTIERWLHDQAKKAPLKVLARQQATKKLSPSRQSKIVYDPSDPETQRKRKDSANRVFRDLRALLNRAYDNQHVASKAPWETLKEFENVGVAKNEYLTLEEANKFMQVCPQDFRDIVQAALITGCRYGELCGMKAGDFDAGVGAVSVIQSKTGKMKRIFLTPDEAAFFAERAHGKQKLDLMFRRSDGEPWGKSHQQPRMKSILKAAGIDRHVRFHDLRHTFATLLAESGTSIQLIANQLGHSGTRMAEKHYAHFSPSYVATTIRANKPSYNPTAPGPVLVPAKAS
jgi:integrase